MLDDPLGAFEEKYGRAGKALSRLIRPMIVAPEGKRLVWGDWSNIEARGLPWLADYIPRLDMFREIDADPKAPDVYIRAAAGMYDLEPYELHQRRRDGDPDAKDLRQRGKIAELALGFGGAAGALQSMAANYGMMFDSVEAKEIVERWRHANKWAEQFWVALMEGFTSAIVADTPVQVGRVAIQGFWVSKERWVAIFLPDGRPLYYRNVRRKTVKIYDEFEPDVVIDEQEKLVCDGEEGVKSIWRGLIAENVTQGACASLMRETLVYLRQPGLDFMPVVGHTHDEIIALVPDTPLHVEAGRVQLHRAMTRDFGWTEGLPLAADMTDHAWYTKTLDD